MSGTPVIVRLLSEQRKRCLATIFGSIEASTWWPDLTAAQQQQLREQVRGALAVFYDLCRDVVKVSDDDGLRNDLALDLIRAVHTQQRELSERLK
jgi:hypothetical protein